MAEYAQYNQENIPMKDILAEIRQMVSSEAQARYEQERKRTKTELLILRPEARVDLLLKEAEPLVEVESTPPHVPGDFATKLQEAIGISDPEALEALIRKVFREEMSMFGD